ncbi:uncharacterized protein A1O9_05060 [Exophiala aquamarina CBS 119918]|uniref:Phosphatidylinositol-specific phospholipase C X domain-containing protein n=1 Tax=Exophiala aquamarina CBS 119918 TaxID=1182545 RepID=A0A072PX86_9EURO|nr:uncharacterized protein A1O9_05060 [Exophiala aquamarina CBS 119918]KEF60210.1 hypothetical protein A1O9_05060 [Exophiala aquamarina CBS 119918]
MLRPLVALLSLLGLASAASVDLFKRQSTACNNSPDLCSRPYNQVVHLGAHDSPFRRDKSTDFSTSGNQFYNSTVQLNAGVRLLSAQVHKSNGAWHLCHSSCDLLDAGTLSDWLEEVKAWMDNNPNDVVTILLVNSDDATVGDLDQQFTASGINSLAYKPASTTTPPVSWPTLQELITAGTRLMVFVASLDPASIPESQSYIMDEFTFIFENKFDNTAITDFSCSPERPSAVGGNSQAAIASNRMPFMNHFLYDEGLFDIQTPAIDNITTTNSPGQSLGNLGFALSSCQTEYGRVPTFTLVDFFDEGPAINAVDAMNGITPVGRTALPPRDKEDSSSDSGADSFQGVIDLNDDVKAGAQPKLGAWIWAAGKWTFGGINLSGGDLLS